MASSASSFSLPSPLDVFSSFRGKDVRRKFLSHLLNEFQRRKIITFVDNGINNKSIFPALVQAINASRISIVILSKNYASSSWCLNELLEIMKCKASQEQIVMTIFYDVDPSDIRRQTGKFGKAFDKTCMGKSEELKRRWRQALIDVANIKGEHSKNWHSEAAMINKIATDVSNQLNSTPLKDFDNFVGMEAHIEKMNSILCRETNETRMIGIWGPAGIGKSTIARALYNQISSDFECSFFMENVKGNYRSIGLDSYSSKLRLQERFLSQVLNDKDTSINNLGVAEKRLRYWKVLLVLDDVDNIEQLNALAGQPQWFGNGSRIIVITEHKDLLGMHNIKHIYEVGFPTRLEALRIFSQSAFRQDFPPEKYVGLAIKVAKLTGLPLGLSVLGSSLRGESRRKWITALSSFKTTLHEDIEKILKVGYDSLDDRYKAIFLYIACLFNGERKDRVILLLENSDLDTNRGLDVLVERALIYISSDERVIMHHLLQQMGQQIVRRQSTHEPGKRQFLLDVKRIYNVLADNTGTGTVLGISFNMSEIEELFLSEGAFRRMHNLRILRFYKKWSDKARVHLAEGLDYLALPRQLRLLHWEACPMKCIPSSFSGEFLVEINMQQSKLEKLWAGAPMLSSLKKLNLSASLNLGILPDLSKATNLESLELTCCRSLVTLPSSIGELSKLSYLHLGQCINLESLPENLALESLSFLNICECSKLKAFPEISTKIIDLSASFTAIREVPPSVQEWGCLKTLTMICCGTFTQFPLLPDTISKLYLDYSGIKEIPDSIADLYGLEILSMKHCELLLDISPDICKLRHLQTLDFEGCINVREFPVEIFQSFSFGHELLLRLDKVQPESLPANIPEKTHRFPLNLFMNDNDFTSIPDTINNLSQLHSLHLDDCWELVSLPELPDSLLHLHATNCESLQSITQPSNSSHNSKLVLNFFNCLKLDQEARKLLVEEWACGYAILPGSEVPEYFTHQATGSLLTIHLDQRHFGQSLRFKACVVFPAGDWPSDVPARFIQISCHLRGKHSTSAYSWPCIDLCHTLEADHMFILNSYFELEEENIRGDVLRFDFRCLPSNILQCGVQLLEACSCKYDGVAHPKLLSLSLENDEQRVAALQIIDYRTEVFEEAKHETRVV